MAPGPVLSGLSGFHLSASLKFPVRVPLAPARQFLRQSVSTIRLKRAQNLVFRLDVCSLAPYPAAIAAVVV